jgi:hypothetical protein
MVSGGCLSLLTLCAHIGVRWGISSVILCPQQQPSPTYVPTFIPIHGIAAIPAMKELWACASHANFVPPHEVL